LGVDKSSIAESRQMWTMQFTYTKENEDLDLDLGESQRCLEECKVDCQATTSNVSVRLLKLNETNDELYVEFSGAGCAVTFYDLYRILLYNLAI